MTRQEFLGKLRAALYGLPNAKVDEIVADYQSHFEEGAAAGRSEAEVAAALGDPARLAKELRAEAHVERWKEERTPSAGAAAVIALIGLIAVDWFFLLPLGIALVAVLFAMAIVAVCLVAVGPFVAVLGNFGDHDWALGQPAALLAGLCMTASGVALGALTAAFGILGGRGLVAWARLHVQMVKPGQTA